MSTAARIEELRKKFDENPRRYFAPLANELRKAGELSQAIALCREHLPKQPGHMSGYIVFGQALYETGDLDEARTVFEQALALDPENLIALRHLGDIARRQGQAQVARRWYERVLEADPRNDDIAAQLATLNTPVQGSPAQGTPGYGVPVQNAPVPGTPAYGAPTYGTPAYGAPAAPTPVSAAPAIPTPVSAPAIPTPVAGMNAVPTPIDSVALPIDFDSMLSVMPVNTPVVAPLDGLSPTHITPSVPVTPTAPTSATPTPAPGFDSVLPMPTPDSAMRAVEGASAADGLLDLDALGGLGLPDAPGTPAVDRFEDVPTPEPEADPFAFGSVAGQDDSFGEAANGLMSPEEAALAFEEGLVAPEWPDTSDLVARRDTPRFATPISVPVTPDAIQAFGREAHDPLAEPLPEPEPDLSDLPIIETAPATSEASADVFASKDAVESAADIAPADIAPADFSPADHATAEVAETADVAESIASHDTPAYAALSEGTPYGADIATEFDTFDEVAHATEQSVSAEASFADVLDAVEANTSDVVNDALRELGAGVAAPVSSDIEVASDAQTEAASEAQTEAAPSATAELAPATAEEAVAEVEAEAETEVEAEIEVAESFADDSVPVPVSVPDASPAFVTETMGELLVAQGFIDRAITVYEELVRRRPYDPVLSSRLAELRDMQEASRASEATETSKASGATPAVPTPAFGTPTASFTPAASYTPVRSLTPIASHVPFAAMPAVETRTARERFAALAARRVARRTPARSMAALLDMPGTAPAPAIATGLAASAVATPHSSAAVSPAEDSLAALFGADGDDADDLAARQLAEAFNPDADVGSLSDSFFAAAAEHRDPTPAFGMARQPTPARGATPISTPAVPPAATPPAVHTGEFSFDRFFPDPARSAGTASGETSGASPAPDASSPRPAPPVDDLAQFSAWLKGLGKS